jgi:hypothetical protein
MAKCTRVEKGNVVSCESKTQDEIWEMVYKIYDHLAGGSKFANAHTADGAKDTRRVFEANYIKNKARFFDGRKPLLLVTEHEGVSCEMRFNPQGNYIILMTLCSSPSRDVFDQQIYTNLRDIDFDPPKPKTAAVPQVS